MAKNPQNGGELGFRKTYQMTGTPGYAGGNGDTNIDKYHAEINGFTVVQSGKFLKVKNARNAQRDSIETYSGKYYPNSDVLITRIVHLKHTSAEEVNKRLRILPSKDGEMTPYEPTNSLIITAAEPLYLQMRQVIEQLDARRAQVYVESMIVKIDNSKAAQFEDRQKGGTFLKTADHGDDEDRIILRRDGTPVYLTADLTYHKDKFDRGFDRIINVFGADHAGHGGRRRSLAARVTGRAGRPARPPPIDPRGRATAPPR